MLNKPRDLRIPDFPASFGGCPPTIVTIGPRRALLDEKCPGWTKSVSGMGTFGAPASLTMNAQILIMPIIRQIKSLAAEGHPAEAIAMRLALSVQWVQWVMNSDAYALV